MKQTYLFVVSTVFATFLNAAYAQNDSSRNKNLPEVTIVENRISTALSKVSQNIQVIHKADIMATPARSLQEVLSFASGVDVRQRGPGGAQADISIRGGSFEQTLVLLNGIKLSDPQTSHHIMNIPLPLAAIDRIDVLKGAGSRIFGQNAFSGAINLVTKIPDSLKVEAQFYMGDFQTLGTSLYASLPAGRYKQTISFSADRSNGHRAGADFSVLSGFYESEFMGGLHGKFKILTGYSARDFGAFGYYTDTVKFKSPWESTSTMLGSVSYEYQRVGLKFSSRAYWRQNNDEFRLKKSVPSFYTNLHTTDVLALELNSSFQSKYGTTGMGVEGRREKINSTNLGQRERSLMGIFIEQRVRVAQKVDFRGGMYSNYYDEYGWKHFPGAELGYQLTNRSRLYANWGKSFRIPSYTELFYQDPNNSSNPLLKPEEAVTYELGYLYNRGATQSSLSWFARNSDNMIDYYKDSSLNAGKWTPRNISKVDLTGIEFTLRHRMQWGDKFLRATSAGFNYHYLDATAPSDTNSRYALTAIRHQWIGDLQFLVLNSVRFTVKGRYISRITLDPYWLWDVKADLSIKQNWNFFTEVTNISNTKYTEAGFVVMPGRWMKAGLLLSF